MWELGSRWRYINILQTSDLAPTSTESSENVLTSDWQDPLIDEDRSQVHQVALPDSSQTTTSTDITDIGSIENAADLAGTAKPIVLRGSSRARKSSERHGKLIQAIIKEILLEIGFIDEMRTT